MVGTEATTDSRNSMRKQTLRSIASAAARILFAFYCATFFAPTVSAQKAGSQAIRVSGDSVHHWRIGNADAWWFQGACGLQYQDQFIEAESLLLVSDDWQDKVRTRLVIDGIAGDQNASPRTTTIFTANDPITQAPRFLGAPKSPPDLLRYIPNLKPSRIGTSDSITDQVNAGQVKLAQFTSEEPLLESPGLSHSVLQPPTLSEAPSIGSQPSQGLVVDSIPPPPQTFSDGATTRGFFFTVGGGSRSVEIKRRDSSMPAQISSMNRGPNETVVVAHGGVTVLVRDVTAQLPSGRAMELGTVSLSANRIVAWMPTLANLFSGETDLSQTQGELYLEGDIVVRQGDRIIYADRMYYNVTQEKGVVLDAEAITTIPEYEGIVRLKADVMQQVSRDDFLAFDAAITTSRLGVPRYWLQSDQLRLYNRLRTVADERTGRPIQRKQPWVSSQNSFTYLAGVPVFYWPRFSTRLEIPTLYISGAKVGNDNAFGTQVLLDWDLFQILGIENAPDDVNWELSTDYLDERGPALGTNLDYRLPGLFGVAGPVVGDFDTWIIDDRGNDRLGLDRLDLAPEVRTRGRSLLRHRHYLPNDYEFIAQVGWLSDRNFLEQFLENEWDQDPDPETSLRLRRYWNNSLFDLSANVQLNDFFTETEQLPSFDQYTLGGSFGNLFTWSAHNRIAYARMNVADDPIDPAEAAEYSALPGEVDASGVIASTQQELTLPVPVGPIKFVPFISGEAAHYGEAADGDSLTRLTGQAGIRASLPMYKADPSIQSSLLNVRGLAHKMEWTAEYFYADSNTDLDELPLYDPLDDNPQEQFRRRFIQDTFGGALPPEFDPRTFAYRQGLQRWVTNPSDVIADDLQQFRLGFHQRFQTKRGLPGRERIVDLLQFDTDLILFPEGDRDNFGETIGPLTYDFRYHIGDRFTVLSDGYFDFFDAGLRSISAGVRTARPGLGDFYLGLLSLEGPISSTVLQTSLDYRLNEKWILSGGTSYDFGATGNIGQTFGFTRIGESFLARLRLNVDSGRDNVGVGFSIEPRFWPRQRLGRLGGKLISPPGVEGLE